jgi:hypothetical protein
MSHDNFTERAAVARQELAKLRVEQSSIGSADSISRGIGDAIAHFGKLM